MHLRELDPIAHGDAVRQLFSSTFCLGRPVAFELPSRYVDLCVGWYLGPGADDGAVIVDEDVVVGYALVCGDAEAHHRWARRAATTFATRVAPRCLHPRASSLRRFASARLRDLRAVRSNTVSPPMPVHAHMNIAASHRSGSSAALLRAHIDERAQRVGSQGWFAEVNTTLGRRQQALERLLGPVVHRQRNHTLSWLAGEPVERLTVVRHLP